MLHRHPPVSIVQPFTLAALAWLPLPVPALCLTSFVAPASASVSEVSRQAAEELSSIQAELLAKATELAERAQKAQANTARDECYRAILCLDPEHKEARKVLGYARGKNGWTLKKYVQQKDRGKPEDLTAIEDERSQLGSDFERRVRQALALDGEPNPGQLDALRAALLPVMWLGADNIELRRELGFELDEEKKLWRMAEILAAFEARAERKELLERLKQELPTLEATEVDESGAKTGVGFPAVYVTDRALVASTGKPEDAKHILTIMHLAPEFLGESFRRSDPTADAKWFIYDLAVPAQRRQFYDNYPGIQGDRAKLADVGSSTFTYLGICGSGDNREARADGITNQRVNSYLGSVFGVKVENGWAWAGLGMYLSYQLCGTRLSQWLQEDKYSDGKQRDLSERLRDPKVDWLLEARALLEEPNKTASLRTVLGRQTKDLSAEELVLAYAFAAFLFEGRRDDLADILREIGAGQPSAAAIEKQLGMSIESIGLRLGEWLQETTGG
jgi:hypothetical protein